MSIPYFYFMIQGILLLDLLEIKLFPKEILTHWFKNIMIKMKYFWKADTTRNRIA